MFFSPISKNTLPAPNTVIIPTAWYDAEITEVSVSVTKDMKGTYIKLVCRITEPRFEGEQATAILNIENKNPQAVRFSQWHLRKIMDALNIETLEYPEQLKEGALAIKVVTRESDEWGIQHDIKDFGPLMNSPIKVDTLPGIVSDEAVITEPQTEALATPVEAV